MYRISGKYGRAERELEVATRRRSEAEINEEAEAAHMGRLVTQRGHLAINQGDYDRAREYYEQSLEIHREIGDRAGEASSLSNLGNIARDKNDLEVAQEHYKEGSELFCELGAVRRALRSLSSLSVTATERDDTGTALDTSETALSLIEEADFNGLEEWGRKFQIRAARLQNTPESTVRLYYHALGHILENEGGTALSLLKSTWDRHEQYEPEDGIHSVILAAGVGVAAHLELFDGDEEETDPDSVLSAIEPHTDDLSTAARALFCYLTGADPEATPADLREEAGESGDEVSIAAHLTSIEARAYAELLELLTEGESED
jgi:tetratricopeptide (TPR) repeat protein